jgi:hypothetical protein
MPFWGCFSALFDFTGACIILNQALKQPDAQKGGFRLVMPLTAHPA